jgi:hypothetical protein
MNNPTMQPKSIRSMRGVLSWLAKDSAKATVKQGARNSLTLGGLVLIVVGRRLIGAQNEVMKLYSAKTASGSKTQLKMVMRRIVSEAHVGLL